jgi:hypothetical protein
MNQTRQAWIWLLALMLGICPLGLRAGVLERALMPGAVSQAHAKIEADCEGCHASFDRTLQPKLCIECHKEVGADLTAGRGFHGRKQAKVCADCHNEHLGLDADIVKLDTKTFDHTLSDFQLLGKHAQAACDGCHLPAKKHREAASTCNGCHAKDDRHDGRLGAKCEDCHDASDWKHVEQFDHSRTRFKLLGAHDKAECKSCHVDSPVSQRLETTCVSCHRKDDSHHGAMGEDCAECHVESDWKTARFDHSKTAFALAGAHRDAACKDCHSKPGDYKAAPTACADCHQKDDQHRGSLGKACESCHDSAKWKPAPRFNHRDTRFSLIGAHAKAVCTGCHQDAAHFRDTARECVDCHLKDDSHKGRNGAKCADCHNASDWKQTLFDHDKATEFALRGAHRSAKCEGCHTQPVDQFKPGRECADCHLKDDKHETRLGRGCADCHQEDDWKTSTYSHDRSRFVLIGKHRSTECGDCHKTQLFADTDRACVSCHRKDDQHRGGYGDDCARCHSARDWSVWDFDHRTTQFALTGAHQRARCSACHQPAVKLAADSDCASCHSRDDVHEGGFGRQCARCHTTTSFREVTALKQGKAP